ncbi:MAG: hypothetical protein U0Q16_06435 [Bryobacteraceae bacterium]
MQFIPRIAASVPLLRLAIDIAARRRGQSGIDGVDWSRVYWTPPLTAKLAIELEEAQIRSLGMSPLVSLTDHDDITGPVNSGALAHWAGRVPISVEWTFPFEGTFFHVGVHNLPPDEARTVWAEMAASTGSLDRRRLDETLQRLRECNETLVVLNHPLWDEKGIGAGPHRRALDEFLRRHRSHIDALEYNGLRPASENRGTLELARQIDLPVVSGGDRHGFEPNSCLNLTSAGTFAEFVRNLKQTRHSTILLMPHQAQHRTVRVIHHLWEILRDDPEHGLGWHRWDQRIFYRNGDGSVRSLREHWGGHPPLLAQVFVALVHLMGHEAVRQLVRLALPARQDNAL